MIYVKIHHQEPPMLPTLLVEAASVSATVFPAPGRSGMSYSLSALGAAALSEVPRLWLRYFCDACVRGA